MRGFLFFLALSSVALAVTIEDTIPDARFREYGETFAHVSGRIICSTGTSRATGSCVPISPHWALTAAHVIDQAAAADVITQTGTHATDLRVIHHQWADKYAEHDIALVHVETPMALARYAPLTDGTERLGTVAAAVGYGATGPLSTGYATADGHIRAGTVLLSAIDRSVYVCEIRRSGSPLPGCIAPGDSGGGLWGTAADGRTVLIGINSFTTKIGKGRVRSQVGEESGHTRVVAYLTWIRHIAGTPEACALAGCQP